MADLKAHVNPLFLREEELSEGMDLFFFAQRDFCSIVDALLADNDLGRAHYRALHFIVRRPDLSVGELLTILNITKQSLSRVLQDLVNGEFVEQIRGQRDRRQRLLHATEKGRQLESTLSDIHRQRLAAAYRAAGAEAVEGFRTVLLGLLNAEGRETFEANSVRNDRDTRSLTGLPQAQSTKRAV